MVSVGQEFRQGLSLLHDFWGFTWKTQELGVTGSWRIEASEGSVTPVLGGCGLLAETLISGTVGWDVHTFLLCVVWPFTPHWLVSRVSVIRQSQVEAVMRCPTSSGPCMSLPQYFRGSNKGPPVSSRGEEILTFDGRTFGVPNIDAAIFQTIQFAGVSSGRSNTHPFHILSLPPEALKLT